MSNLNVVLSDTRCDLDEYDTDDIELKHYTPSNGMTFVKVKNPSALKKINENIDWDEVFNYRNKLNSLFFNEQTVKDIENKLVISL